MNITEDNKGSFSVMQALQSLYRKVLLQDNDGLARGLANLATLPEFDLAGGVPVPVPGQESVQKGLIAFRRLGAKMALAVAGGASQVRYIPLEKFIALIERMNDGVDATIVLQNHQIDDKDPRGQIIARINPSHSALHILEGVAGRVIKKESHVTSTDVFYFDRTDLAGFYLAAKVQLGTEDQLESLIAGYDGWKAYDIPLNPLATKG